MNSGHSAAWEQQWEQAANYYRQALAESPDHPAALTSLGLALFELQQYEDALRFYQRGARVAPSDPIPLEKIARIYQYQGKMAEAVQASLQAAELQLKAQEVQKAVENWLAVLRLQPENLLARTRLGMVYERTNRKLEAVSEYLAAASIIQRSGDMAKTIQLVEHALQIIPESGDARRAMNMVKAGQMLPKPSRPTGDNGGVPAPRKLASSEKKELPAPTSSSPMLDPVSEARQAAMVQVAAVLFDQADDNNSASAQARRGIAALTRGIPGLSDDRADDTRILLHLSQAIESITQGQDSQAAAELERANEAGLNQPAALFLLGQLLNNRDPKKSLHFLQDSVKHPDFALASYLLIAQNYESQDNLHESAVSYLEALRLADVQSVPEEQREELEQFYEPLIENQSQQSDETVLKNICETIAGQLMRADWREYLRVARQQLPGQPVGGPPIPLAEMMLESRSSQVVELLSKVRLLAAQSKYRSAMEEAFYAVQFAPTYLPLHVQIGEMLLIEGHTQSAVNKFLLVAQLYNLRGEAGNAVRLLTRAMQMAPMDISIRMALIELLIAQGRVDEAMQQYMDLGDFYYQMSDLDKARQTYLAALRVPQATRASREMSVRILHKAADIDLQRLDWRQALRTFEQIRNLQPGEMSARTNIIDLNMRLNQDETALAELDGFIGYLESLNQRAQAIEFLDNLLQDRPERLDMRKRLADLYARSGDTQKAVEELDMIADGLLVTKNKAGAISVMESILALNPPNVAEYREALSKLKG